MICHHVRDKGRYTKRFCEVHPGVNDPVTAEPSPERHLQRKQARCAISNALDRLSGQQAEVLLLHVIADLSHKEIAEKTGMTESAIQKCFQRTRDKLAECISDEHFCAMPPFVTSCDEPPVRQVPSRWPEWSHYSGQIVAAVMALSCFVPLHRAPRAGESTIGELRTIVSVKPDSMYHRDKPSVVHDERKVLSDCPSGKPEPASLRGVQAVPVRTSVADKPASFREPPLPPFKHVPRGADHEPLGR